MALINTRPLLRLLQRRRFLLIVFSLSFTYCMVSLIRQGSNSGGGGGGSLGLGGGISGSKRGGGPLQGVGPPSLAAQHHSINSEPPSGLTGAERVQLAASRGSGGLLSFIGGRFGLGSASGNSQQQQQQHNPHQQVNNPTLHKQEIMIESDEMRVEAGDALQMRTKLIQTLFDLPNTISDKKHASRTSKAKCRNSIQGRVLIADDEGRVCARRDVDPATECCPPTTSALKYSCDTCDTRLGCCAMYEHCVSCCLDPQRGPLLARMLETFSESDNKNPTPSNGGDEESKGLAHGLLFTQVTDPFELCLAKCRTNSLSVHHENAYRDPIAKHCFTLPSVVADSPAQQNGSILSASSSLPQSHSEKSPAAIVVAEPPPPRPPPDPT